MERDFFFTAVLYAVVGGMGFVSLLPAQQKEGNPLIVPGKSVGEIALGMENPEIYQRLGKSAVGDAAMGRYWDGWFGKKEGGGRGAELNIRSGHSAEHDKDAAAEAIRVESPFFHTKEGIGTQSSVAEVWKAFPNLIYTGGDPNNEAVEVYEDDARGMAIEVRRTFTSTGSVPPPGTSWGACQAIIVFPAGETGGKSMPTIRSLRSMPDRS